nr:ABC transporter permease [Clostridium gallinarum]
MENIKLAMVSLLGNKLRSILTMLGIIIGISSVITIVTIGDSLASSITGEVSGMGARNISVNLEQKSSQIEDESEIIEEFEYVEPTEKDNITDEMLDKYKTELGNEIIGISISENGGSNNLVNGKNKASIEILGVNDGYFKVENINLLTGRFFYSKDINEFRCIAVVSDMFVDKYFGKEYTNEEALGKSFEITINDNIVRVYICGIYEFDKSATLGYYSSNEEISTSLYMPISVVKKLNNKLNGYSSFKVLPNNEVDVEDIVFKTNRFFEEEYKKNEYIVPVAYSMESMIKAANKIINSVKLAISAVAAISLLVGGIGVMNIMMVSITERTKEIGIRKALGASNFVILIQFIIESIIICIIGGIIGILIGIFFGSIGAKLMGYSAKPNLASILIAVGFCMSIGVFFGYYPARKAAKLNPIDALRYE